MMIIPLLLSRERRLVDDGPSSIRLKHVGDLWDIADFYKGVERHSSYYGVLKELMR